MKFNYKISGDQSILLEIDAGINKAVNAFLRSLSTIIENEGINGIGEVVLGYNTLLINYNPLIISYDLVLEKIIELAELTDHGQQSTQRSIEIPVVYGGEWGPDLTDVAKINGLTKEEVIEIHRSRHYLVYFLGFTPGYPFMGGMSKKISTPRLPSPRIKIPSGSVGIAQNQTGIYPVDSPGGWRLIGRTPINLYDPKKEWPFSLQSGDIVKFKSITSKEYEQIKYQVDSGQYKLAIKK